MSKIVEEIILKLVVDDSQARRQFGRWSKDSKEGAEKTDLFAKAVKFLGSVAIIAGLKRLASAGTDVALQFDKIERSLEATLGSAQKASAELKFLANTSEELGTDLLGSADAYSKFLAATKGTNITLEQSRELFLGIQEASVVLGLSAADTAGALRAVQQSAAKGRISLEELTGQLGERLPGAMQAAARGMGVTQSELIAMVETGEVMAEDLLPKLGKALREDFGEAAKEAAGTSAQSEINRLSNAWNRFLDRVGNSLTKFIPLLTKLVQTLDNVASATGEVVDGFHIWRDEILGIEDRFGPLTEAEKKQLAIAAATKKAAREQSQLNESIKIYSDLVKASDIDFGLEFLREELGLTEQGFAKISDRLKQAIEDGDNFVDILKNARRFIESDNFDFESGDLIGEKVVDGIFDFTKAIQDIPSAIEMLGQKLAKSDPFEQLNDKVEDFKQTFGLGLRLGLSRQEFEQLSGLLDQARRAGLSDEEIKRRIEELRANQVLGNGAAGQPLGGVGNTNIAAGTAAATQFLQSKKLETLNFEANKLTAESMQELLQEFKQRGFITGTL